MLFLIIPNAQLPMAELPFDLINNFLSIHKFMFSESVDVCLESLEQLESVVLL